MLLDGIFVIGVTEEVERETMDRNIQRFGMVPKASEDAARWSRCAFGPTEITFSGVIMSRDGCRPEARGFQGQCSTTGEWQSRVGSLLWALRVRHAGAETATLLRQEWLLSIWSRVAAIRREREPCGAVKFSTRERATMETAEAVCHQGESEARARVALAALWARWRHSSWGALSAGDISSETADERLREQGVSLSG